MSEEQNEWTRFGTGKVPDIDIEMIIHVEVLFDDGTVLDYNDENWPFAEVTHWRFKKDK